MVGMSDEAAKAVQEVAKVTGKAIDSVNKSADFLHRLIGQSFEDTLGVFVTDPIRVFRTKKLIDRMNGIQQKMLDRGITDVRTIAPKIILPLLDGMSLEDNPVLEEMWENMMVSAANPKNTTLEKDCISVLGQFTANDALLFGELYSDRIIKRKTIDFKTMKFTDKEESVLKHFSPKQMVSTSDYRMQNFRNLIRYGLFTSTVNEVTVVTNEWHEELSELDSYGNTQSIEVSSHLDEIEFTKFGLELGTRIIAEDAK